MKRAMHESLGDIKFGDVIAETPLWQIRKAESAKISAWFKILDEKYRTDSDLVELYLQAGQVSQPLHYRHIGQILGFGSDKFSTFMVYKPCEGERLSEVIAKRDEMSEEKAVQIVLQICKALQYAHLQGVEHGALTPDSIFVSANNEVTVLDFGSGALIDSLLFKTGQKSVLPFALYLPPEKLLNKEIAHGRHDVYALGVIFYQMLTGKMPFKSHTIADLIREKLRPVPAPAIYDWGVSPNTENLIKQLLLPDRKSRMTNLMSLAHTLVPEFFTVRIEEESEKKDAGKQPFYIKLQHTLSGLTKVFSPTLVGSKRRTVHMMSVLALAVLLLASLVFITELSTRDDRRARALYREFVAEESDSRTDLYADLDLSISGSETDLPDTLDLSTDTRQSPPEEDIPAETRTQVEPPPEQVPVAPAVRRTVFVVTATANSRSTEADVYLDDRYIGTTAANRPLVIGEVSVGQTHRLRVHKEGFETWSRRLRPATGDTNHVAATLQPSAVLSRQITFRRVSFADRIVIDDSSPGYELPAQVDLSLGQHTLRYVDSATSFAWETHIVVSEVSINEIAFMAEHIGYGELSVILSDAARYGYAFVVVNGQLDNKKTTPFRLKLPVGRHRIQVLREGFRASPADTVIFVPLDAEVNILCSLRPE